MIDDTVLMEFDWELNMAVSGFIHTCNLLGMNYCVNYLLNDGLYCTKSPFTPAIY